MKLLEFLKLKLGAAYSAKHLKRALENNLCKVNDRIERFGTAVLGFGDQVSLHRSVQTITRIQPAAGKLKVLFEDDFILAVDKPAGLAFDSDQLINLMKCSRPFLVPVHRLDKETSGALLYAKTPEAAQALMQLFKVRKIKKSYLAIVDGVPAKNEGVIESYMGKLRVYQGQTLWGEVGKEMGVLAVTEWHVQKKGVMASLVLCLPLTGRTHQIRVHLSRLGHPILGDKQYGKKFSCVYRPKRCLLHAYKLSFDHPFEQKQTYIEAPLPVDFSEAMTELHLI